MANYNVCVTAIFNGSINVDADSEREAIDIVEDIISKNSLRIGNTCVREFSCGEIDFDLGEVTADYAEREDED